MNTKLNPKEKNTKIFRGRPIPMTKTWSRITGYRILLQSFFLTTLFTSVFHLSALSYETGLLPPMTCYGTVQLSLGTDGETTIIPAMLLSGDYDNYDDYSVDIAGPLTDEVDCSQIGYTLTVKVIDDNSGNSCWSYVTIKDKKPPDITCNDVTLSCLDDIDSFSDDFFISAEDNCTPYDLLDITSSQFINDLDCHPNYVKSMDRTWYVTDASGNLAICEQTIYFERIDITVTDFPADISISCLDPDTSPEKAGQPMINDKIIAPLCDIIVWKDDFPVPMPCEGEDKIIRTWYVMDICSGQMETETQNIIIEDKTAPEMGCPDDITISTGSYHCKASYVIPDITVNDFCSEDVEVEVVVDGVFGFEMGEEIDLYFGDHTISYIATDDCHNSNTCKYFIQVEDHVAPTANCTEIAVTLGDDNTVTIYADQLQFEHLDNCQLNGVKIAKMFDDCGNPDDLVFGESITFCCADTEGKEMAIIKVYDIFGNSNICMFEVDVKDPEPPDVTCNNDITIQLDENGEFVLNPDDLIERATDNCGILDSSTQPDMVTCANLGIFDVTVSVFDLDENEGTCIAEIKVEDNIPPDVTCQDITVELDGDGLASITPIEVEQASDDNCGIVNRELDIMDFDCNDLFNPVTVTLTVTDASNNQATCTAMVTVKDKIDPTATDPDDTILQCVEDIPMPDPEIVDDEDDNCPPPTVLFEGETSNNGGSGCFGDPLEITREYSVTDDSGNSISVSHVIIVEDTTPPTGTAPADITVECVEDIPLPDAELITDEMDNCDAIILVEFVDDVTIQGTGCADDPQVIEREYSITDCGGDGNQISVVQTITVKDLVPPTGTAPADITVECVEDIPLPDAELITDEADNCDAAIIVAFVDDPDNGGSGCAGDPLIITHQYSITDCNGLGNSIMVEQTITVEDVTPPSGSAPADMQFQCIGEVPQPNIEDITDEMDNCDASIIVAFVDDVPNEGTGCVGDPLIITREYSITDCAGNGNSISVFQTFTIEDTMLPTGSDPAPVNVECPSEIPAPDIEVVIDEMDNCPGVVVAHEGDMNNGGSGCTGDPFIITREYSITDCSGDGNTISVFQTITQEDNVAPTCSTQDITVCLDENGIATTTADAINNGSTDNCDDMLDLSIDQDMWICNEMGMQVVTLTVTDDCGNASNCTATVMVKDKLPPTCNTQDIELMIGMDGTVTLDPEDLDNDQMPSTDNCAIILTFEASQTEFNCSDVGDPIVVDVTVTDFAGNKTLCTANVTITDPGGVICDPMRADISGVIYIENGEHMLDVPVKLSGTQSSQTFTDQNGRYRFEDLEMYEDYTITPEKDDQWMNGLTAIDAVLMQRYILGLESFNSPYKVIAADIDRSNAVSARDVVRLKKLLIGLDERVEENSSWRFIDANYIFEDPDDPLGEYFDEAMVMESMDATKEDVDFIALKVGDVNSSANASGYNELEIRTNGIHNLWIGTVERTDEGISVPFSFEGIQAIVAIQLAIDASHLTNIKLESDVLGDLVEGRDYIIDAETRTLKILWTSPYEVLVSPEEPIFKLIANNVSAIDDIRLQNEEMQAASFELNGNVNKLDLNYQTFDDISLRIKPNPFTDRSVLEFYVDQEEELIISIFDANGQLLFRERKPVVSGKHEFEILNTDLSGPGVYFITVQTATSNEFERVILIK